MEQQRYFYSIDGGDAHGPVTVDVLRLLSQNKVIGTRSFLCREGENEWYPFNPESIRLPVEQRPAPYEPPPFVHTPESRARSKEPPLDDSWDDGPAPRFFTVLFWVLAVGASLFLTTVKIVDLDKPKTILYRAGVFIGSLFILVLLPSLFRFAFRRPLQNQMRVVGVFVLALLAIAGAMKLSALHFEKLATANGDATAAVGDNGNAQAGAPMDIATNNLVVSDTQHAEQNLQAIKDQATDDSQNSRIARDLLVPANDLMVKVKVSQDAEKACDFEPSTITSLNEIDKRRSNITKLRDAQGDVILYLQNYDAHCRAAMAHDNLAPSVIRETIATARQAGRIDLVVVLWQTSMKLSNDHLKRLDYLEKNWGHWSAKDGQLIFPDDATLAGYNSLVETLQEDVRRAGDVQKQIFK